MEILRAEHLTKIYGKGNTSVTAVNDLSLSVAQGEFVAVVGSSGSGKSTLLHMLGGVDQPTEGKVWIQGEDIYTLSTEKLESSHPIYYFLHLEFLFYCFTIEIVSFNWSIVIR